MQALTFINKGRIAMLKYGRYEKVKDVVLEVGGEFVAGFKDSLPIVLMDFFESDSDSDSTEFFDPNEFGCGDVTSEIESMVNDNWRDCHRLEEIYGEGGSANIVRHTILQAKEESQCTSLKFFGDLIPLAEDDSTDLNRLALCGQICYYCCCEVIKKTSPVIAEATLNLIA